MDERVLVTVLRSHVPGVLHFICLACWSRGSRHQCRIININGLVDNKIHKGNILELWTRVLCNTSNGSRQKAQSTPANWKLCTRFVCNSYRQSANVSSMLHELSWPLLEQRRAEARLGLFCRIVKVR